ncbi:hypothetical protein THII_2418 [Thioploca ingrica]|uniref:Uncharacterized protein n=1 Tax=Thioploca ingrica TaxID=40754 RepID=A0A090AN11_9GAMM|nr:hypothetical protein THII_2418 [Thioploca ingrica]
MGETQIICVNSGAGLHMLGRGSNGDYYDPATGTLNNNWGNPDAPGFGGATGGMYEFTGLWLVLN